MDQRVESKEDESRQTGAHQYQQTQRLTQELDSQEKQGNNRVITTFGGAWKHEFGLGRTRSKYPDQEENKSKENE